MTGDYDVSFPSPGPNPGPPALARSYSAKWFLWHGNVFRAQQVIDDLAFDHDIENPGPQQRKPVKALAEFATYIRANAGSIPNYDERYRADEPISSSFAESTINQVVSKRMVKKQQMRWSPRGAHLLLQIRTRLLNDGLANEFHRGTPASPTRPTTRTSPRSLPWVFRSPTTPPTEQSPRVLVLFSALPLARDGREHLDEVGDSLGEAAVRVRDELSRDEEVVDARCIVDTHAVVP